MSNKELVVLTDFDGTITKRDVGNTLFTHFSNGVNLWVVERWKEGDINSRTCLECECVISRATESEFLSEVDKFDIDEYFVRFYELISAYDIPIYILSDGVDVYIKYLLNKFSLTDIPFYSNQLHFNKDRLIPRFPHHIKGCGLCGNCKLHHYNELTDTDNKTVYIGDGYSDRHIAEVADILFAKSNLAKYCDEHDIPYHPFNTFQDIIKYFESNIITSDNLTITNEG